MSLYNGRPLPTTPSRAGTGKKTTTSKNILLRKLAQQKREQIEQLKAEGKVHPDLPNDLEHWLFMYSDYTIARLNNELLKMQNEGNPYS